MSEPTLDPAPKLRLLSDTFTRPFATKPGDDDNWPVVTGLVRPAMPREVSAYAQRRTEAKTGEADDRVRCEFYARHLKTWDVEGDDGQPMPISAVTVACLPYPVWVQLEQIVLGFAGADLAGVSPPVS